MEFKEEILRKLLGKPPIPRNIVIMKRKFYSYSVTSRSIIELVSIIIAPVMFAFFVDNRYAIDLGYESLVNGELNYLDLISSTMFQILVELLVIFCCSLIEFHHNIPLSGRDFVFLLLVPWHLL